MDRQTALARYHRSKITDLNSRFGKGGGGVTEFAYRDEYGRYQEDERGRNAGIGAGTAAAALGGGIYARGRMTGRFGPTGVERYARDRFQGLVRRGQEGINPARIADGTYKRNAMKDAAVGAGRNVRDAGRHVGKVTRRSLRSLLLRGARGLR